MSEASSLARAQAALELGRWQEAVHEALRAIGEDPEGPSGHYFLGRALLELGREEEALHALETACAKSPTWSPPHVLRSDVLRFAGSYRQALAAAEEALRLDPHSATAHMAVALSAQKLGDAARARGESGRALALAPHSAPLHRCAGDVFLAQHANAQAESQYRRSLELDAGDALALNNLALALQRQGKADEALDAFRAAVNADPNLHVVKRNLRNLLGKKLGKAGIGGIGVVMWLVLQLGHVGSSLPENAQTSGGDVMFLFMLCGLAFVALGVLGVKSEYRRRLSELDPDLRSLHERLEADHHAGRL